MVRWLQPRPPSSKQATPQKLPRAQAEGFSAQPGSTAAGGIRSQQHANKIKRVPSQAFLSKQPELHAELHGSVVTEDVGSQGPQGSANETSLACTATHAPAAGAAKAAASSDAPTTLDEASGHIQALAGMNAQELQTSAGQWSVQSHSRSTVSQNTTTAASLKARAAAAAYTQLLSQPISTPQPASEGTCSHRDKAPMHQAPVQSQSKAAAAAYVNLLRSSSQPLQSNMDAPAPSSAANTSSHSLLMHEVQGSDDQANARQHTDLARQPSSGNGPQPALGDADLVSDGRPSKRPRVSTQEVAQHSRVVPQCPGRCTAEDSMGRTPKGADDAGHQPEDTSHGCAAQQARQTCHKSFNQCTPVGGSAAGYHAPGKAIRATHDDMQRIEDGSLCLEPDQLESGLHFRPDEAQRNRRGGNGSRASLHEAEAPDGPAVEAPRPEAPRVPHNTIASTASARAPMHRKVPQR